MPDWAWWLLAGVAALGLFYAFLPWLIQWIVWVILWPRYRLEVVGGENLPRRGPVLVAINHISWIDGFVIAAALPRNGGTALVNAQYLRLPVLRQFARRSGLISLPATGPRGQRAAIDAARAAFAKGDFVVLFPEGQISRSGLLGPFYRGLELMLKGHEDVPVVPVYIDNLWGSIFSFEGGRFFGRRPRGWRRRRVVVAFGPPVEPPITAFSVRQAVQAASVPARARCGGRALELDTIDLNRPHLEHPEFGLLAASTPDFQDGDVQHVGQKPGSVGQALPGVAIRAVDDAGRPLPADAAGRLQVLRPGLPGWTDLGLRGRLDREGFLHLTPEDDPDS